MLDVNFLIDAPCLMRVYGYPLWPSLTFFTWPDLELKVRNEFDLRRVMLIAEAVQQSCCAMCNMLCASRQSFEMDSFDSIQSNADPQATILIRPMQVKQVDAGCMTPIPTPTPQPWVHRYSTSVQGRSQLKT